METRCSTSCSLWSLELTSGSKNPRQICFVPQWWFTANRWVMVCNLFENSILWLICGQQQEQVDGPVCLLSVVLPSALSLPHMVWLNPIMSAAEISNTLSFLLSLIRAPLSARISADHLTAVFSCSRQRRRAALGSVALWGLLSESSLIPPITQSNMRAHKNTYQNVRRLIKGLPRSR